MARKNTSSAIIDNILRLVAAGSFVAAGLLLPGLVVALDKPLQKYLNRLDKRSRERELRRIVGYMKTQRLVGGSYQHGLQITDKGRERLKQSDFESPKIRKPAKWDKNWRLVFFDIPESQKTGRDHLTAKLRRLGFYQMQRSVWIHPFPCREIIESVCDMYSVDQYVTYVETGYIDNQKELIKKFESLLTS